MRVLLTCTLGLAISFRVATSQTASTRASATNTPEILDEDVDEDERHMRIEAFREVMVKMNAHARNGDSEQWEAKQRRLEKALDREIEAMRA